MRTPILCKQRGNAPPSRLLRPRVGVRAHTKKTGLVPGVFPSPNVRRAMSHGARKKQNARVTMQEESMIDASAAAAYENRLVPAFNTALAQEIVKDADWQVGDRVLDIACGTAIVVRLAAPIANL